MSGVSTIT